MSGEECQAVKSSVDERIIIIKKADKVSYVVVWDRKDYFRGAEKQVSDTKVYRDVRTLKIFSVSYQKQVIKSLVVFKCFFFFFNRKAIKIFYLRKKSSLKKLLTLINYTFCLRLMKGFIISRENR